LQDINDSGDGNSDFSSEFNTVSASNRSHFVSDGPEKAANADVKEWLDDKNYHFGKEQIVTISFNYNGRVRKRERKNKSTEGKEAIDRQSISIGRDNFGGNAPEGLNLWKN